jgi:hypothetical protein
VKTGFFSLLFVVFLVLKLTGVIGWSWWWVTAPLWGGFLVALIIIYLVLCVRAAGRRDR